MNKSRGQSVRKAGGLCLFFSHGRIIYFAAQHPHNFLEIVNKIIKLNKMDKIIFCRGRIIYFAAQHAHNFLEIVNKIIKFNKKDKIIFFSTRE